MSVIAFLEKLEQFAHEKFPLEMDEQREWYLRDLGIVHESEEYFEENMKAFLDWFVFERPLKDHSATPLEYFIAHMKENLPAQELKIYEGFRDSRHSLFFIKKVMMAGVECKDLFSAEKVTVTEEVPSGFLKGEICESRIFPVDEELHFGEMFRFHPKRANKIVKKAVKKFPGEGDGEKLELMLKLAKCKIRHHRYPRIDLVEFYKEILSQK